MKNDKQLDLFAWADSRPSAEIIDWIPHLAKRMWAERGQELPHYPETPVMQFRHAERRTA
jgi:hypothetical protein